MRFFTRIPDAFRHIGMPWSAPPATAPVSVSRPCTVGRAGPCKTLSTLNAPVSTLTFKSTYSPASVAGASGNSGRVVISGRMADVCAELDRLVAMETQPTLH